jgi:hypothetical protein
VRLANSLSTDNISFASLHFMVALMFIGAWWTTRKPGPYRNPWAVAASVICVATGGYIAWSAHTRGVFSRSGWLSIILGIAGLYLYSQGGRAPRAAPDGGPEEQYPAIEV